MAAFTGGQDDVGSEQLFGIHLVEFIKLVAKIAMHFNLATLCDDVLNLFTPQHTQHGGHPVAGTTAEASQQLSNGMGCDKQLFCLKWVAIQAQQFRVGMNRIQFKFKLQYLAFLLAMAVIPLMIWLQQRSMEELKDSRGWLSQSYTVLDHVDHLRGSIEQAEAARRGFLITRQRVYLGPYFMVREQIPDELAEIKRLTINSPAQQKKILALKPPLDDLLGLIALDINADLNNAHDQILITHRAKELIEQCRSILEDMRRDESVLLDTRRKDLDQHLNDLGILLAGSIATFMFLLAYSFLTLYREVIQRRQIEQGLLTSQASNEVTVKNLSLIGEMTSLLQACSDSDESLRVVAQFASRLLNADSGTLYLFKESRNQIESKTHWGELARSEPVFQPDDCWALRRGEAHVLDNSHGSLACKHLHQPIEVSSLCMPIVAQGNVLGILHLENFGGRIIDGSEIDLTHNLAGQIALALASANLRDSLRSLSVRDPLTGLFNRRYMEESLKREVATAQRKNRPFGLAMLDIDHFKNFNDTFGHEAGDYLLREVGALFISKLRQGDVACRFGGEEFVMIYPEASPEVVVSRANQLRESIYALQLQHFGRSLGQVSASFGLAFCPEHGDSGEQLLRAADIALYRAKENGRNRVEVAIEVTPEKLATI